MSGGQRVRDLRRSRGCPWFLPHAHLRLLTSRQQPPQSASLRCSDKRGARVADRTRYTSTLRRIAAALALLMIAVPFFAVFLAYDMKSIPSGSMEPTLRNGDRVLVRKDGPSAVARGDVVVFRAPNWLPPGARFVKRVVGVSGDHVVCCTSTGQITVNGKPLDEPYVHGKPQYTPFDVVVPSGRLFVLGDNRPASRDSRFHMAGSADLGTIARKDVDGRVERVVWPPSHTKSLGPDGPFIPLASTAVTGLTLAAGLGLSSGMTLAVRRIRQPR